ncbi:MAG: transposase [Gammaproteobacteria bacterium]|nr:transposase [Gammaproteobacteria bacterium]
MKDPAVLACESIFDHAAKSDQSKYPWAQNVVAVGLLQRVKGRWACLPLAFRYYLPEKTIKAKTLNVTKGGKVPAFQTKLAQAATMILEIAACFAGVPVLVVTDSWFGNNGLFKPLRQALGVQFHLLSRLRVTSVLYDLPPERRPKQRGARRKYGQKLGSAADLAAQFCHLAKNYQVHLYGKSCEILAHEQVFMLKTLR